MGLIDLVVLFLVVLLIVLVVNRVRKSQITNIICPNTNCGYKGKPTANARGSVIVGLLLCLFFLFPGIIYFIFMGGYRYKCPNCGLQISTDN